MKKLTFCFFLWSVLFPLHAKDFSIPNDCKQLIVGIAKNANSSEVILQRWVRVPDGWRAYEDSWRGRIGRDGLAWGRGIHPDMSHRSDIPMKVEGDWRAPAGVFALGSVYGYEPYYKGIIRLHYYKIDDRDLWIEDPTSAYYNMHLRVSEGFELTDWQKKQRMKFDDPAHKLELFIKHNFLPEIQPGGGSSIFFHIWRENGKRPSSGCTTMPEEDLRKLISWLDPERNPLFVLLPESAYEEFKDSWRLP